MCILQILNLAQAERFVTTLDGCCAEVLSVQFRRFPGLLENTSEVQQFNFTYQSSTALLVSLFGTPRPLQLYFDYVTEHFERTWGSQ
jgi:hypothetical protein